MTEYVSEEASMSIYLFADCWQLSLKGKTLQWWPMKGSPDTLYTCETSEIASRLWRDLRNILTQSDLGWVGKCLPEFIIVEDVSKQVTCLTWDHPDHGKLAVYLPHCTYQITPREQNLTELRKIIAERSGLPEDFVSNRTLDDYSPEVDSARAPVLRMNYEDFEKKYGTVAIPKISDVFPLSAEAMKKQELLCKYSNPQYLCWHDGTIINVPTHFGRTSPGHPENKAIRERNVELATAALLDLRRLSHYVFREWPTCGISKEPVALVLSDATDSFAVAKLVCRHCNKDYKGLVL